MATYTYKVRDATGKLILSSMEADSARAVRDALREKNFFIVSIDEPKTGLQKDIKIPGLGSGLPGLKAVAVFSRQIATMINSGLPLVQSLAIMQRQVDHPGFKKILAQVRTDVEGGAPFSDALKKHPKVFSPLYLNLVRAGEASGNLDQVLDRVSTFLEKDLELRGKIKSAMTYPAVVMTFALGVAYFLLTTIVPQFASILTQLGGNLPAITLGLIAVSNFLQHQGFLMLIVIVAVVFAYRTYYRTNQGRHNIDRIKLKIPVFGNLTQKSSLASFSRTFSLLLKSGVNIIESLEITRGTANNAIVEDALVNARDAVQRGEQISQPLSASPIFPAMVVSMVAIGEETGAMDAMLSKVADFYEREVDEAVDQLTAALEPMMIVFLGTIVGLIVAGMFLPMFSIIG
ncbi:MAG TPA: type II secretion system F family protein, partial [Deinococcales bacterium]|nr:type II secretion system F family protein [Deinococcales bacterium]